MRIEERRKPEWCKTMKVFSYNSAITRIQTIIISVIIIVAAIVGVVYYVTLPAPTSEVIKIGVITPLSAPADYISGNLILDTARLFVETQNAKGGVLGKNLELVEADQTLDPSVAISALGRMTLQDNIVALVGPWESSVALPVAEATESFPVIMFVADSWADGITSNHYKYVFRTGPYNSFGGFALVDFLKHAGYTKVVTFVEESSYGIGFNDALVEGGKEKFPELEITDMIIEMGRTDFTPEITVIQAMEPLPDVVGVVCNIPVGTLIVKQLYDYGLSENVQVIVMAPNVFYDPSYWETLNEGGVGVIGFSYSGPEMIVTEKGEEFIDLWESKYGATPTYYALFYYWDSLNMLVEAIEETDSTNPDTLAEYLEGIDYLGTVGSITYTNDPTPGSVFWHQWLGIKQYIFQYTEYGKDSVLIYPLS